ncbi:MAG TPA: TonB family protein, partial [Phenylobacterium sp.]
CSADGATGRAKDLALEAAALLKLPPLPRPRGRMAVTLTFAGDPPPPADKSVITAPSWLRLPSGQDIARVFPERAQRQDVQGAATVLCTVSAEGTLVNCEVTAEAPGGMGFGGAAMKLTPLFKLKPQTRDGTPVVGGTVRIPIRFVLPKG